MDSSTNTNQTGSSDESELAKALAAISDESDAIVSPPPVVPAEPVEDILADTSSSDAVPDFIPTDPTSASGDNSASMAELPALDPIPTVDGDISPSSVDEPVEPAPAPSSVSDPLPETVPMMPDLPPVNDPFSTDGPAPSPSISAPIPLEAQAEGDLDPALEAVKSRALDDLKPLMSRIELDSSDKFNLYLLMIQSSGDRSLLDPAYETAHSIEDEAKKAQALLDIIREIDRIEHTA